MNRVQEKCVELECSKCLALVGTGCTATVVGVSDVPYLQWNVSTKLVPNDEAFFSPTSHLNN